MTPTERRRPVTRRRRLAHLGVGGVVIAAASVRALTAGSGADPAPVEITAAAPIGVQPLDEARQVRAAAELRASRSERRLALAAARPTPTPTPSYVAPTSPRVPVGESVGGIPTVWLALAGCESSGDWHIDTSNDTGGLQILTSTWLAEGGGVYAPAAYLATPVEQLTVGRRILASGGVGQWPVCGPKVGLQRGD